MERTLRETEFFVSQAKNGHQAFRSALPIRPIRHNFHAAADGQLGGIMKVYRDWHIYGNDEWLKLIYSYVQNSLDYCINTWDPKRKGVIEEPHHNTYDIEFWGPSGMINSYYTGALQAFVAMGEHLEKDMTEYRELLDKSIDYMEINCTTVNILFKIFVGRSCRLLIRRKYSLSILIIRKRVWIYWKRKGRNINTEKAVYLME